MAHTYEEFAQMEALEKDGSKRLPICFCLDTSGSMGNDPTVDNYRMVRTGRMTAGRNPKKHSQKTALAELKKGLNYFFDKIRSDDIAASAAEVAIVTFDDYATTILDFCRLSDINNDVIESIETHIQTKMADGLELALDKLNECIQRYKEYDIEIYAPWLVVMSDGDPSDKGYALNLAKDRIADMCKNNSLVVIPIGIGKAADMETLSQLAEGSVASRIYSVDFEMLFNKLGDCIEEISRRVNGSGKALSAEKIIHTESISDERDLYEEPDAMYDPTNTIEF